MDSWSVLFVVGVMGCAVGCAGAVFTILRALPWGKGWHACGIP